MTCKEKLKLEHPEDVGSNFKGGCYGCPDSYGYLKKPDFCPLEFDEPDPDVCAACWDREITEENDKTCTDDGPRIRDSGNRTEFPSGAVRDMRVGKGRCDLMPLEVIGAYYKVINNGAKENIYWVFHDINRFCDTNDIVHLYRALERFGGFSTNETMFLEVAKHFEEGCKKYGDDNWKKGIPVHCYIDSAVRHYLKYLRGDKDEPHDRAFCWNILCCIWTCQHKPELNDYAIESGAK